MLMDRPQKAKETGTFIFKGDTVTRAETGSLFYKNEKDDAEVFQMRGFSVDEESQATLNKTAFGQ